ncbi:MAG: hypothetical protein KDC35_02495 [Acidobacteria bacterium]|nr:hypothetical protein [Acidobacteriota bacterium]
MSVPEKGQPKKKYVPAVGPRLKKLLAVVFGLFALLVVNSVYLSSITIAGTQYQNWFYLLNFALHLALGLLIVVPVIVFGLVHIRNTYYRKNRRAIRAGYALFTFAIILLISGIVLTRLDLFGFRFEVNDATTRSVAYWAHVISPLLAIWLFVLHRLAGKKIKWRVGLSWAIVAALFASGMLYLQTQDPRSWNVKGPASGEQYFFPSLARTSTGNFIPQRVLKNDQYCQECHTDVHKTWTQSVHKFSSFNNPPYEFSVKGTRRAMMERDGHVRGSRFCAGCHDPVPFFSGAFDDPKFDDPNYDLSSDPTAQAGITCTVCHSISHINSPRGNSDYTITEPVHYPFAFSNNGFLKWVNRQLVKAKPEFHKATFLKPLHKTPEFCGTCHKVHLPPELNAYKWLRGQNHYDSYYLSGVSGHTPASFYYPPKAQENCNGCHMPLIEVSSEPNFAAQVRDDTGLVKTFDHMFPTANTAIPVLVKDKMPDFESVIQKHMKFNEGVVRVDIFGIKEEGRIDGALIAPIRPQVPALQPGKTYLIEAVIRTVKMGHHLTQGTVDSNELWMDVAARMGDQTIGRSGARSEIDGSVDPWSHFVNVFVLDREGNRINRRNAEDIFVPLYNNQIPPGGADVVHYRLQVPADAVGELSFEVALRYRKFDTEYMRFVTGNADYVNELPIMTMATDSVTFPIAPAKSVTADDSPIPLWQRWNDYGIGLLLKGKGAERRQALAAFEEVERLGRPEGPVNQARVYLNEGLIQTDAPEALARARELGAHTWWLLWFGGLVAEKNGDYELAITQYRDLVRGGFEEAVGRGFNFGNHTVVRNTLANALMQYALAKSGETQAALFDEAKSNYEKSLAIDPENLAAHWGLKQLYGLMGNEAESAKHGALHAKYKPDDNARDRAVAAARRKYPAANHAAEDVVIYDLTPKSDQASLGGMK